MYNVVYVVGLVVIVVAILKFTGILNVISYNELDQPSISQNV